MTGFHQRQLRMLPLAERHSKSALADIRIDPDAIPHALPSPLIAGIIDRAAAGILKAKRRDASIMLIYGAHLLRNGAAPLVERMLAQGWLTHLATNGAGTIHDWEFAHIGRSTESVRDGVAHGRFGTWSETGAAINLAVQLGAARGEGYGEALGRWIDDDGADIPEAKELADAIRADPAHPLTAARADLLNTLLENAIPGGRMQVAHPDRHASMVWLAYRHRVPLTVHPGIGYDIIANHPMFSAAAIGRGAGTDYQRFTDSLGDIEGGVALSIGSAIMGPQVFEKSMSCVNNLRLQAGKPVITDFDIHIVDIQDGGGWDWAQGEPPKTNPAYYLRFCKSFARMGGRMSYACCDNVLFLHHLYRRLVAG
jgi:hypothetical protein